MTRATRRGAVAGLAGLGFGAGAAIVPLPLHAKTPITAPQGPMLLKRRIERALRDGATLVIEREWEVRFAVQGQGIAIGGRQLSAHVEAPAALAALARIEEDRSTEAMWAILLAENGLIAAAGTYTQKHDIDAAASQARSIIAKRPESADAKALHRTNIAQLQKAGGALLDQLPPDLFFPASDTPREMTRKIEMAGGQTGRFIVRYVAKRARNNAWLAHAQRTIVTAIGDDERRSSDTWVMSAL
ncbi:hypothetical protein [Erythrobacter ani]|uniref:Uncharacterized protein n=1 Tax=Erythrobacter ani TaxID=2827235 RepID=A0ABS6SKK5_9SPHN|nr:hypothetical protein [Erythrobacter ani]MBV7265555.1 hypothetical protein [Erythrobacter ani]